jgi:parvulin-like peptidyl-prolyl isomerase
MPKPKYFVFDYETGNRLQGEPTPELVKMSYKTDDGAVSASVDDDGVWHYVPPQDVEATRRVGGDVRTVFVDE